jgi:hypothetical protein
MPTSRPYHLTWLCDQVVKIQPRTILDVGIGYGSKGMLFREYTDVWTGKMFKPEAIVDGVEIFPEYVTDLQRKIYNNIYIGNILDLIDGLGFYELIYMGDVLEHFNKEEGKVLLEKLKQRCRHLFIVTPVKVPEQGSVYGNEHETHRSEWAPIDFGDFDVLQIHNSLIATWKRPEVYYCEGMKFYGERMESVFGFRHYSGDKEERLLFMGLYFQEDYDVYKEHTGQKIVFWNGSDVQRLLANKEWVEILKEHPGRHVCHNQQLYDELKSVGIEALIEPIFFAYVSDYKESYNLRKPLEVYINTHPGREAEYGVTEAVGALEGVEGVELYIYGIDGESRGNLHYMGWLEEEEADKKMSQHHVCLRLNRHDGLSQLVIKAALWGHHIISRMPIGGAFIIREVEDIKRKVKGLRTVKEPNIKTREFLKKSNLNRFSWL